MYYALNKAQYTNGCLLLRLISHYVYSYWVRIRWDILSPYCNNIKWGIGIKGEPAPPIPHLRAMTSAHIII